MTQVCLACTFGDVGGYELAMKEVHFFRARRMLPDLAKFKNKRLHEYYMPNIWLHLKLDLVMGLEFYFINSAMNYEGMKSPLLDLTNGGYWANANILVLCEINEYYDSGSNTCVNNNGDDDANESII